MNGVLLTMNGCTARDFPHFGRIPVVRFDSVTRNTFAPPIDLLSRALTHPLG
jgi:hypothetical protein